MRCLVAAAALVGFVSVCGCETAPAPVAKSPPTNARAAPVPNPGAVESAPSKPAPAEPAPADATTVKSRQFTFHYKFRVKDLKTIGDAERGVVRLWVPEPSTNEHQKINRLPAVAPAEFADFKEGRFGHRLRYVELSIPASGEFSVDLPYEVVRRKVHSSTRPGDENAEIDDMLRATSAI